MEADPNAGSKRDAKDALQAARQAVRYLEDVARFGAEFQITRAEFDAAVLELRLVHKEALRWQALVLAMLNDQPCPQALFKPWASQASIWIWRNAKVDPLPAVELNGKVCLKPSEFFQALQRHGMPDAAERRRTSRTDGVSGPGVE